MALFGCISSRSSAAQTSSPDNTCCIRALSSSDRSTRIPEVIPEATRNRKHLERKFHEACVQLVSLNFILHETRTGSTIDNSPKTRRIQTRKYNQKTLNGLRDMYYKSVQEGADRLDLLETGFEDFNTNMPRNRNVPKPKVKVTSHKEPTKHRSTHVDVSKREMTSDEFKDFCPASIHSKRTFTKASAKDFHLLSTTSSFNSDNNCSQKYDANDSACESRTSSMNSMSTLSASYDVSAADIWVKKSLSFEEEDEGSIDSGFDSRNSTRTVYRSTYV